MPADPDTRSAPQAQRGGGGTPCQHLPAWRGSARRRLSLLLAPRQDPLSPPPHRHCGGRERKPGRLGAPHLQVAPVAGSVRHQLGWQTGGGCIRGHVGSLGWRRGGHPACPIAVPRSVPRFSTGTRWRGSKRRSAPRLAPALCGARGSGARSGTRPAATRPWPAPTARGITCTTSATARLASAPLSPRTGRWCWVPPAGTISRVSPFCRRCHLAGAPGVPPLGGHHGRRAPRMGYPVSATHSGTGSPGWQPRATAQGEWQRVPRQCWCSPPRCSPGLVYSVELDKILGRFLGTSLLWLGSPGRPTEPVSRAYDDGYRGYAVAVGEFDGNPKTKEYVVGVPNKSNTRGEVEIFTAGDTLRWLQGIASEQVASYFGHTVAVADVDGDGRDDLLVGAPLYMARCSDGHRSELGRLYIYLGRGQQPLSGPPQTLTGTHPYGRFAAAIASLGDLDKDGFGDVAVGAPQGGDSGSGQVFIFRGQSEGLAPVPTQRLNSPFPGPAAFGFALRGATDLDGNGYADLLVGAYGAAKVAVYQGLPVVVAQTQLSVPDGLNPEILDCDLPDSSVRVSCFHVVFCVSVTGQHIPQSIHLEAELQLDRLKPRPSRRVLLLQGHQSSWQEELVVTPGTPPVCSNLTAYLRDKAEFKDKLSPVALSVALKLTREAPGLVLYGHTLVQAQTHIMLEDCGDDNLCVPDLHLAADTPSQRLLIGAEAALSLHANATNAGEGAFEAELRVQLPPGTHYQAARSTIPGQEKLSCNPKKENGTHVVLCELGNPMKAGAQITVDMELSVSGLEDIGEAITFHLQLRSKNSPSSSNASVMVTVPVEAEAEMQLRGNSLPAITVLPTSWHWVEGSQRPEDHGIKVEHVYELHNKGPGIVSGVTVSIAVPHLLGDHVLLYLLELGTEGGMNCSHHPALNPAQLGISGPTAAAHGNGTHQRERREAEPPPGAGLGDFVHVNCDNATCVDITCHVASLGKDQRALVSVHALLWMDTLQQREHLLTQFIIQSHAWFNTSAMPYHVQPRLLPTGRAQTDTRVVRTSLGEEGAVPVWWVVLGVLAGLLLLTLLILLMWKTGFFKRTRPPAEGDTQEEPSQAQEPGSAQD
ncbi:integrin alpha-IIb isoform X1 [Cinclus cinclus]|uniref:integrin alpha-IIb isoform X1 n=1 Tax=Cinclus cinclus TaxID=127875 RepID=UPI002E0F76A1